ncbi:MAG: CHAT domain-containing protein [Gemmatimonadetes bacterium]|nr:CHAT domain-containing protein [Gemmatimonadota bacterium]
MRALALLLATTAVVAQGFAADLSRTEIANALIDAGARRNALVDSLLPRYRTYNADVVVILHRIALDEPARGEKALAAATAWCESARDGGDTLPATIQSRFLAWDESQKSIWRAGEESYRTGARALQSLSYDEAEAALRDAIDRFRAVGDDYRLGLALSYLGLSGLNRGDWSLAMSSLAAADSVQERSGDIAHRAATLSYRAQIQEAFGDYDGALTQQEQSLAIFRALGSRQDMAETLQAAAHILAIQAHHERARQYLEEALALHDTLGNPVGSSQSEIALGNLAVRFGDFDVASARYERALRTIEENDLAPLRSELLHARGILAGTRGDHENAARFYAEAAAADSALGNLPGLAYARIGQSISLLETGAYDRALPIAHEVRAWARESGMPSVERLAWETIGRFALRMNDIPQAKNAFEEALGLARSSGEVVSEAENLLALARIRSEIGEPEAVHDFRAAIALFDSWSQIAAREEAVLECAMALLRDGRYDEAGALLAEDDSDRPERLYARALLAVESGRPGACLALLAPQAEGRPGASLPSPWEWRFADLRARALAMRGEDDAALLELSRAVDRIETLRGTVTVVTNRGSFLDNKIPLYRHYVKRLLARGEPEQAFAVVQRAKGRTFRDLLHASPPPAGASATGHARHDELRRLERKISHLEEEWIAAENAGLATEAKNLAAAYDRAVTEHAGAWEEDAARNDRDALPDGAPFEIDRLRESLADDEAALLEYWPLDSTLALFVVTRDTLTAHEIPITEEELAGRVRVALSLMRNPEKPPGRVYPVLRALHEILIPNAVDSLGCDTWYVVPEGPLFDLPFHALVAEDAEAPDRWDTLVYLGDRKRLSVLPSSALLTAPAGTGDHDAPWLILADPASPRAALPFARAEGAVVRGHLGRSAELLERNAATESAFRGALAAGRPVHVAAHGSLDPLHPLYSYIRLAPDSMNDGRLAVHELFGLRGTTPFLFLSACETGGEREFGGAGRGYERFGLARGLFAAGADAMIVTLWKVDDYATSRFVETFYAGFTNGQAIPAALAAARARFRARPFRRLVVLRDDLAHPYYWAGFVYYGRN